MSFNCKRFLRDFIKFSCADFKLDYFCLKKTEVFGLKFSIYGFYTFVSKCKKRNV